MDNRWASPDGYEKTPTPVRYQILEGETVVERTTVSSYDQGRMRYYHCLQSKDQKFADGITALIQQACEYFYVPDGEYEPLEGVDEIVITDDDVYTRIHRIDAGENSREAERAHKERYPLEELPFEVQRALIERIDELKRDWKFKILGESDEEPVEPSPTGYFGEGWVGD